MDRPGQLSGMAILEFSLGLVGVAAPGAQAERSGPSEP
jgi:hypothetical protein